MSNGDLSIYYAGTRQQRVTWSAESGGSESIALGGTDYTAEVIFWEMETVRWDNGTVTNEWVYFGEDLRAPELAFAVERYIEAEVDGLLWFTSTATLIDMAIPAN